MADNSDVTLRDVLDLQQQMHTEFKEVRKDITELKVQSAQNTAVISAGVSLSTSLIVLIVGNFFLNRLKLKKGC